ncbi:MAG: SAM-dependent DNA methyltransferase, partial [Methylococcales bacterium]
QFDHRWATYRVENGKAVSGDVALAHKQNPHFCVTPRYWVDRAEVEQRLRDKGWNRGWLLGWRDICRSTDERTAIASVLPRVGVNHKTPLIWPNPNNSLQHIAAFLGSLLSLTFDYVARQKIGGTSLTYFYFKQLPVLPPETYTEPDLAYLVPRVLELTYTAHDLKAWARDLGFDGPPFGFDPERRAIVRAELDAWYARAYGLNRDELRYILDPAEVMGDDYPSETFRVLKTNELREFGEYRTRRLVLEAWDKQSSGFKEK